MRANAQRLTASEQNRSLSLFILLCFVLRVLVVLEHLTGRAGKYLAILRRFCPFTVALLFFSDNSWCAANSSKLTQTSISNNQTSENCFDRSC